MTFSQFWWWSQPLRYKALLTGFAQPPQPQAEFSSSSRTPPLKWICPAVNKSVRRFKIWFGVVSKQFKTWILMNFDDLWWFMINYDGLIICFLSSKGRVPRFQMIIFRRSPSLINHRGIEVTTWFRKSSKRPRCKVLFVDMRKRLRFLVF